MISTDAGYESTRNALAILERGLASMTRRRGELGPNFHFDAVQLVEEILKLRAEIDGYTGLAAFLKEFGPPPGDTRPSPVVPGGPTAPIAQPSTAAG